MPGTVATLNGNSDFGLTSYRFWQALSNFSYCHILAEFDPSPISNEIVDYFFIFEYPKIA